MPIRPDWPFDIRRLPFFYGWLIWLLSTLGFLFSIPGQTMGMAVFTDPFIEVMGLSRTELSLAPETRHRIALGRDRRGLAARHRRLDRSNRVRHQ